MKVGLALYLGAAYGGVKGDLMDAAQVMPDADYGFKPAARRLMRGAVAHGAGDCAT
jgi:hypothetical protein